MVRGSLIVAAVAFQLAAAAPTGEVERRDGKDQVAVCPQILPGRISKPRTDYFNGQPNGCPIKNALEPNKSCLKGIQMNDKAGHCAAYCEVKNTYFWGKEIPLDLDYCREGQPCTVTNSQSLSVAQSYSFNAGLTLGKRDENAEDLNDIAARGEDAGTALLKASFNLGASYTYTVTREKTLSQTIGAPTNWPKGSCGYWTSVPAFITSCGSLTTYKIKKTANPYCSGGSCMTESSQSSCDLSSGKTTPNWCQTTPIRRPDGSQFSHMVFVLFDCKTYQLYPLDQQDPVFAEPGVALGTSFIHKR